MLLLKSKHIVHHLPWHCASITRATEIVAFEKQSRLCIFFFPSSTMQASELQFLKKKHMVHRLPWHYCASTSRATSENATSKNKNYVIVNLRLLFVPLCNNDPEQQEEMLILCKEKS
jgi:hypothetical protein